MSTTPSPTVPFETAYYSVLAFTILGCVILALLCCGCVASAQNNHAAWVIQERLLRVKLNSKLKDSKNVTLEEARELLNEISRTHNEGGLMTGLVDSIVVPVDESGVSKDVSAFFYHSTLGRFLLVANQGLLNMCCLVLSLIFSGLAVTYINVHIVPTFVNQAQDSLSFLLGTAVFLLIMTVYRDQYNIFLQPRLGGTGVVERLPPQQHSMM